MSAHGIDVPDDPGHDVPQPMTIDAAMTGPEHRLRQTPPFVNKHIAMAWNTLASGELQLPDELPPGLQGVPGFYGVQLETRCLGCGHEASMAWVFERPETRHYVCPNCEVTTEITLTPEDFLANVRLAASLVRQRARARGEARRILASKGGFLN